MNFNFDTITNAGEVRTKNEDFYVNSKINEGHIFVICDGIGGTNGGEIASEIAGNSIVQYLMSQRVMNIPKLINDSLKFAHNNILLNAEKNKSLYGMGTTIALVLMNEKKCFLAHVGDSRIYFIKEKEIELLTKDHSIVQQLIDAGEITNEIALKHPLRNYITHSLGSSYDFNRDYTSSFVPSDNSYLLLCTDGLHNMINYDEICSSFSNIQPKKIAEVLMKKALEAGGKDNITITIIRFNE